MTVATSQPTAAALPVMSLRSVSRSHVGRVRTINEDRVFDCAGIGCWAVADGMGGHRGGDVAAQTAIDCLRSFSDHARPSREEVMSALDRANDTIYRTNLQLGAQAGTTIVAAVMEQNRMCVAWAGDSRAYLVREGTVAQLTRDHSFVQELVDAGLISPSEAREHPKSNIVTRALGIDPAARLDRIDLDLLPDDRILLCSDGLSRSLDASDLIVSTPIDALADSLLGNALRRDGSDNVSLVVLETHAR
jgi:serine/threonine protein phosphatase PrpC